MAVTRQLEPAAVESEDAEPMGRGRCSHCNKSILANRTSSKSLQAFKPSSLQAFKPSSLQAFKPSSLQAFTSSCLHQIFTYAGPRLIRFVALSTRSRNSQRLLDPAVQCAHTSSVRGSFS